VCSLDELVYRGSLVAAKGSLLMQLGKYQLVSKLATGGMAEVYLARAAGPAGFEKTLVLKRILPHLAEDSQFVEMFLAEARLAAQLDHPNVVQIFDFGEEEGTWYLAMEYVDGVNLRVLARKAGAAGLELPPGHCARIIASACEGLAYAHERTDPATGASLGLIHRDISPDNILLSRQGAVKVVDFGIAKAAGQEHQTRTGVLKGKLAYMPPEQLQAHPVDLRVDVYALGVVLYELLTGQKPFEAHTEASIMQAILFEPLIPVSERRLELPPELVRIVDRALAKTREERYPDCRSFQADLERYLVSTGEPVGPWQLAQLVKQVEEAPRLKETPVSSSRPRSSPRKPMPEPTAAPRPPGQDVTHLQAANETLAAPMPDRSRAGILGAGVGIAVLLLLGAGALLLREQSPAPVVTSPARQAPPVAEAAPVVEAPPVVEAAPVEEVPPVAEAQEVVALAARVEAAEGEAEASGAEPATEPVAEAEAPAPAEPPAPKPATRTTKRRVSRDRTKVAASSQAKTGTVAFRIRPYATVVLGGRKLGQTPLAPVELPAGRYTVKLINQDLEKEVSRSIEVRAGEQTLLKHNLLED